MSLAAHLPVSESCLGLLPVSAIKWQDSLWVVFLSSEALETMLSL